MIKKLLMPTIFVVISLLLFSGVIYFKNDRSSKMSENTVLPGIWKNLKIKKTDFDNYHLKVKNNKYLVLGSVPVSESERGLDENLKNFLGRWEGYDLSTPVKNDLKIIFTVKEIDENHGKAIMWAGYNLQFPMEVKEVNFQVIYDKRISIKWSIGGTGYCMFSYNKETKSLEGCVKLPGSGSTNKIVLKRNKSFYIYKNYKEHLAEKGIVQAKVYDKELLSFGPGYLIYLPQSYKDNQKKKWPLIIYLCGTGEKGNNLYSLPKIGPLQMVSEIGSLPFVIVAPGLMSNFSTFPEKYMNKLLDEVIKNYNVDKRRIYVTGLSLGGEATYRFAMNCPKKIAAIAPLAAANPMYSASMKSAGYKPYEKKFARIKNIPVWHIHGENDTVVPLKAAQKTANDFIDAGVDVKFTVLKGHDHNVWTDTYLNNEIYDWFLKYTK